jgi:predicted dehydrogenase
MSSRTHRRQFLKQSAAAGIGFWVAGGLSLRESRAANEQVNIACIGIGGKGDSDSSQAGKVGNIVAICDIDDNRLGKKGEEFKQAKKYFDYRKMFDEIGKSIDAVTVSTPDHHHAFAAIMAMKLGKHVYCQKPLTHTVYEARLMRETADKMKVVTQMGNQGSAADGLRLAVQEIQDGVLGKVTEAHVWTNRPAQYWLQAPDVVARPMEAELPKYVHWDEFIGGSPMRPYAVTPKNGRGENKITPAYHPHNWRGYWDFGTGALGDMGCHTANLAFRALKLGHPTSVVAESSEVNPETYPAWAKITYEFPARDDLPPVKLVWYEGSRDGQKLLPPAELSHGEQFTDSGSLLVGEKGVLYSPSDYGNEWSLLPKKNFDGYKKPALKGPSNNKDDLGMKIEWVAGIKGGPAPYSNFDFAALMTETLLLGNVAVKLGKKLDWDAANLKVTNVKEAEHLIKTAYRKGWTL